MLIVIGAVLVFFPACIALSMHSRFVRPLGTAGQKWIGYGAYCCVIAWADIAAKYLQGWGNADILTAFQSVKNLAMYGLLSIAAALIAPLLLSALRSLAKPKTGKEGSHER